MDCRNISITKAGILAWVALVSLFLLVGCTPPIMDSALTPRMAIHGNQPPDAPGDVLGQLAAVTVLYYGFDQKLHQGQVVVHSELAQDIRDVFTLIRQTHFPIESALPIAHPLIQAKGPFGVSPDTNNSSGFVWRPLVGMRWVSLHALGLAIDINPRLNPFYKHGKVLPPGASYDPAKPGTLTSQSSVVKAFKRLGWEWGGTWPAGDQTDYMHFQKIPPSLAQWVKGYRS
ncbi:MAG: M15 family metallopeptidase [Proteobacteria bacterium]|nr:M15 family metallopeptidase [Pseudomonadota bacterium]MBU1610623.1 M15 family metallopeptidase [Pseudomonadota bacterium]